MSEVSFYPGGFWTAVSLASAGNLARALGFSKVTDTRFISNDHSQKIKTLLKCALCYVISRRRSENEMMLVFPG